uniref:Endonuclease n=1 Tax=Myoviridae sp. ct1ba2 TaxID=2827654 RepID=A0A8S5S6V9_9CAUD|nr:MAG TPA: Endonuclease [Myoviridae sp. ct1ba2]
MVRLNKYNAKKTVVDGIEFDSIREADRYCELKLLEKAKKIRNLELQPRFLLQDKFKDKQGNTHRKIEYVADFLYIDKLGRNIVEDVKGVLTDVYKLKKKMFLKLYDNQYVFREIR